MADGYMPVELPKSCRDCENHSENGLACLAADYHVIRETEWFNDRPKWCPIVPAADVRPVIHAKWDADGKCTACGKRWDEYMHDNGDDWGYFDPMPPFCLNCGATMDADMRKVANE